jgi:AmmeMemoRadiSam system protein A
VDRTSAPVIAKEGAVKEVRSGAWSPGLTGEEQETLMRIAEDTLEWCVNGSRGKFAFDSYTLTPRLREKMATFVTLKQGGHLRGCIGSLAPVDELYISVHGNAVSAAMRDFRFKPLAPRELKGLELHISILSPIVGIASLDEFKIGEHGIIMEKGRARAVYLPEVAVEQAWTRDDTLRSLSEKAGLDPDAWKQGATFKVFSSAGLSRH